AAHVIRGGPVAHVRLELELGAHIVVEGRHEGRTEGAGGGVALRGLAGGVVVDAQIPCVQAARDAGLVPEQALLEAVRSDAQLGLQDVVGAQAREGRELGGNRLALVWRELVTLGERGGVFTQGELAGLLYERRDVGRRVRYLLVVPGGGRHGGQVQFVGLVHCVVGAEEIHV